MSELVWIKNQHGQGVAEIWHGPPFAGVADFMPKGIYADRVLQRTKICEGEERLGVDELARRYPLK